MKFFIAVVSFCTLSISAFAGGFAAPVVTQVSNLSPIPVLSASIQAAENSRKAELAAERKQAAGGAPAAPTPSR